MLKKRVIFILFYLDGYFHLSRNFSLQKVGDVSWLLEKFLFLKIGDYIDELIILDLSNTNEPSSVLRFREDIQTLMARIFVPLTLGGGIKTISDVPRFFDMGADKISLNWALGNRPELVSEISSVYGSQAVVASLDVRKTPSGFRTFLDNGEREFESLHESLKLAIELGAGELLINSIDRDGTGFGLDMELVDHLQEISLPIIVAGGAGKPIHFYEALVSDNISGVATGNLFNFIGSGFFDLRNELCRKLPALRRI